MTKSSLALSNLRGFAIVMVVAFHSCIAYLNSQPDAALPFDVPPYGWRANPIVDSARWLGFDLFCAFQYIYLMQLLFFLSGLFVWPSLSRKGGGKFLYDRFLRLGVPFAIGLYVLMPVAYYPVYRVTAVDPSWSAFWSHWIALPFWPSGPMWFLWLLLVFNVAAAGLFWLAPRAGEALGELSAKAGSHPGRFFIALVSVLALAYLPLATVFEPWQWMQFGPFAFQPSLAPQYVIYFFASLGLVLCPASACLALAAVFLRFAGRQRPVFESLADNAYGIYLVHYVFVIWLQYILLHAPLFAVAKAEIVFTGALTLSWATTAAICRVPIGARLMGRNRRELARAR